MGYTTDYWGNIRLSSVDIMRKIKKKFPDDEDLEQHFDIEGITTEHEGRNISLGGYGKLYENELEKFCLFIAKIDRGAKGSIECKGEDNDDMWAIEIKNGSVVTIQGEIVYSGDREEFESSDINRDIYAITGDKELLKEIMLEELDK